MASLSNPLLHRYWFPASVGFGVGVTAFSIEEARGLAKRALQFLPAGASLGEPIQDIDIAQLEQQHVIPNMGPCNLRGVWYPNAVFR
jgi:hypothetical protein